MKTNKIYLIATGVLILGILLVFSGLGMLGFDLDRLYDLPVYVEKEYEVSNVTDRIDINVKRTDVEVISSYDEKIRITYNDSNKDVYSIKEGKNGTLDISRSSLRKWYDYILNIEIGPPSLLVSIPENYNGDINIGLTDGDIDMYEINVNNLQIKVMDGKITLDEVTAVEDIQLKTTAGSTKLQNVKYGNHMESIVRDGSLKGTLAGDVSDYNITCKIMDGKSNLPSTNNTQGKKTLAIDVMAGNVSLDFQQN